VIPPAPSPAVVHANYFQFPPSAVISYPCVRSRMLLWSRAGRGTVTVNKRAHAIEPNQFLFLPWGHAIEYRSDARDPYLLAGVHLIPRLDPAAPTDYHVAHGPDDALWASKQRLDAPLDGLDGIVAGDLRGIPSLRLLANYIVELFVRAGQRPDSCRVLAGLLIDELRAASQHPALRPADMPAELERLLRYIEENLARHLSMDELIDVSGRSASTIGRLFRRHFGISPSDHILNQRIERAKELLRTTRQSVASVGKAVGVGDPYYFSRLFRQRTGVAPLAFRKKSQLL
jgi:AraC-like DNA-binding protein